MYILSLPPLAAQAIRVLGWHKVDIIGIYLISRVRACVRAVRLYLICTQHRHTYPTTRDSGYLEFQNKYYRMNGQVLSLIGVLN